MKTVKSKKKATSPTLPSVGSPVNVALPNTTEEKMRAIVNTSQAVLEVAKALNSVNTEVTISNNYIAGADTGIRVVSNP